MGPPPGKEEEGCERTGPAGLGQAVVQACRSQSSQPGEQEPALQSEPLSVHRGPEAQCSRGLRDPTFLRSGAHTSIRMEIGCLHRWDFPPWNLQRRG